MPRRPSRQPTERELEILQILWSGGPLELGQLCAAIRSERPVATTTVATMLKVMLAKDLVRRDDFSRPYRWSARATRARTVHGLVRTLVDGVFEGSAQRLVAHLIEDGSMSPADREELRRLLKEGPEDKPRQRAARGKRP